MRATVTERTDPSLYALANRYKSPRQRLGEVIDRVRNADLHRHQGLDDLLGGGIVSGLLIGTVELWAGREFDLFSVDNAPLIVVSTIVGLALGMPLAGVAHRALDNRH